MSLDPTLEKAKTLTFAALPFTMLAGTTVAKSQDMELE